MTRLLEILLAAGLYLLLLLPFAALLAGVVVMLTGVAFIPVFAPMTTLLVVGFFVWMGVRETRRRRRTRRARTLSPGDRRQGGEAG